jgi:iron complex transport system permease protein
MSLSRALPARVREEIRAEPRLLREGVVLLTLLLVLVGTALLGISVGAKQIPLGDVVSSLIGLVTGATSLHEQVILQLRLPRVLLGIVVGATLAMTGAACQGIFRNPLAEPGLIGISIGAMVAVVATLVLGQTIFGIIPSAWTLPTAAFIGALASAFLVQGIARQNGDLSALSLILAGVAVNALGGAIVGLLFAFASDAQIRSATFWSLGSLGAATWTSLLVVSIPMIICLIVIGCSHRTLNALQLGDAEAAHLGINVRQWKRTILIAVSAGVGAAVAFTGLIGFVGLVVPHLVRLTLGGNHRIVLPASALLGGALLVCADMIARTVAAPIELPIGALTAILGTPYFLWLLGRSQGAAS